MAIEGPLKELGIHDVFQLLDLSRKTGILQVTSELRQNQGTIYFNNGSIVFGHIRSNPHRLGQLLVKSGKITESDLERARNTQDDRGGRLGQILVDMAVLSQRDLDTQVARQIEEVVFEVMGWQEGYFSFTEEAVTDVPTDTQVRLPVEAVLMEGARRIDEWSRIQRKIRHLGMIPTLSDSEAGEGALDLRPPEWETLAAIDGKRDVREIASTLGRSEFDVAKTIFGLASTDIVLLQEPHTRGTDPAAAGDVSSMLEIAERHLHEGKLEAAKLTADNAARVQVHDPRVHAMLGRIHLAAGRAAEAVEELQRAVRLDPLFVGPHRLLGFSLSAMGRFDEALQMWQRWHAIAANDPSETDYRDEVERARQATEVLVETMRGVHG